MVFLFLDYSMAESSSMFQEMEAYIVRLAELESNASIEEAADVICCTRYLYLCGIWNYSEDN